MEAVETTSEQYPLLLNKSVPLPTLTLGAVPNWVGIHLVMPDGRAILVPQNMITAAAMGTDWVKRGCYHPNLLQLLADACGWGLDPLAVEVAIGRWVKINGETPTPDRQYQARGHGLAQLAIDWERSGGMSADGERLDFTDISIGITDVADRLAGPGREQSSHYLSYAAGAYLAMKFKGETEKQILNILIVSGEREQTIDECRKAGLWVGDNNKGNRDRFWEFIQIVRRDMGVGNVQNTALG